MPILRRAAALILALASLGAASAPAQPIAVTVSRGPDNRWTAEFDFPRRAGAWVFLRPAGGPAAAPLSQRWSVTTPGLSLARRGPFDVLSAEDGPVPQRVVIDMGQRTPQTGAPFNGLEFSDGALIFYTGQFMLLAQGSAAEAEALPPVVVGRRFSRQALPPVAITLKDPGRPILWRGQSLVGEAANLPGSGGYAVFGRARARTLGGVPTLEDRNLPPWLAAQIECFLPELMGFYARGLGERRGEAPTIAMAWAGRQHRDAGFEGRVIPGAVSMRFAGDAMTRPRGPEFANARRFLAHEVAHFWLGQTAIPRRPTEAWTYEGGAEALAALALSASARDDDARAMLQRELDRCLALTRDRPFARALQPAAGSRGPYACGAMLALAAEAATARARPGAPPLGFHRALIARARTQTGALFDAADWVDVLRDQAGAPMAEAAQGLIAGGEGAAERRLAELFELAGLPYRLDPRGHIRLGRLPAALYAQGPALLS